MDYWEMNAVIKRTFLQLPKLIDSAWRRTFIRPIERRADWMKGFMVGNWSKPGTRNLCTYVSWIGKANRDNHGPAQLLVVGVNELLPLLGAHIHFYFHHCLFVDPWEPLMILGFDLSVLGRLPKFCCLQRWRNTDKQSKADVYS